MLHLDHHGRRLIGHVVPGTTAAVYNGTPAISDVSLLKVGGHVQVIGAWHPTPTRSASPPSTPPTEV
ncbi:hypothetical protein O7626_27350 [Micromonospora sp. WMMD1102]|uniref:hypothetical protein n=1 Tax=Micromonospora sp. WMMD1102 TaxID=3016105 RepID=UPI0024153695|nr:hypothetical protein [Micromonospora sp. WMMD1102]MDG4789596.1 hypothetical protein [Micromonospora sp. WMMD1102]